MNNRTTMTHNFIRLLVFIVSLTLIGADLVVSVSGQDQNTNSGTMASQNDNTSTMAARAAASIDSHTVRLTISSSSSWPSSRTPHDGRRRDD